MTFRFPRQARDQTLVASPKAVAGAFGQRTTHQAQAALPTYRAVAPSEADASRRSQALHIACRTLAHAPATEMVAISVTAIVGRDANGIASLRALVDDLAGQYGFRTEVGVDSGSFTVRFSRG